jgi:hypothetical protein
VIFTSKSKANHLESRKMSTIPPEQPGAAPPAVPPPPQPQVEIEYRSLREFFEKLVKYTYTGIVVLLAVAAFLLWHSTAEVKEQASQAILATQKSATEEIAKIGRDASIVAQTEAKKAIDAALDKPGIQHLIEHSVEEKVGSSVDVQVQKDLGPKIEAFRNLVTEIGEISSRGAQLRFGFRPGLDYLIKRMESPDPTVRAYAKSTLILVGADYEQRIIQTPGIDPVLFSGAIGATEAVKTGKGLMGIIHNAENPATIAGAFFDMKKRVGWDVQTFDIPAADKWCASHKPKCDE